MSNSVKGLVDLHVPADTSVGWRLKGEEEGVILPGAIHDDKLYLFNKGITLAIAAYEHRFVGEKDVPNWRIMVVDGIIFRWNEEFANAMAEDPAVRFSYDKETELHQYYMSTGTSGMVDKVGLEFFEGDSEPIKDWLVNYSGVKFPKLLSALADLEGLKIKTVGEGEKLKSSGLLGILVFLKTGNMKLGALISSMETMLGMYYEEPSDASPDLKKAFVKDRRDLRSSRAAYGEWTRLVSIDLPNKTRHLENLIEIEMSFKEILSHLKK